MKSVLNPLTKRWITVAATVLVIALAIAAVCTYQRWLPAASNLITSVGKQQADQHASNEQIDSHAGHDDAASLTLSEQARKNIGLTTFTVGLRDFQRTVIVPAVVVERPGRSEISVSAPMTGIVTRIYPIRGEAVAPGDPLFDLRLTHEDLVEKQTSLLRDLEQRDVVQREIVRLEEVTASGALAGKTLLEKVYERQKIEASIRAEREALLLHGLNDDQVDSIDSERRLVRQILLTTPLPDVAHSSEEHEDFLQVSTLAVRRGDHVETGGLMATLTDHCQLYIEGMAFEHDADALNRAAREGLPVSALIESNGEGKKELGNLRVLYVQNQVERDSRALKFYVSLTNQLARNDASQDGHRFIACAIGPDNESRFWFR